MEEGAQLAALWSRTTEGLEPWLVHDGLVFAGRAGRVAAFETETGGELWSLDLPDEHPNRFFADGEALHCFVGYHHLVIDVDLGEVLSDVVLAEHVAEGSEAAPVRHRTTYDESFTAPFGSLHLVIGHDGLHVVDGVGATRYEVLVRHRFDHAPALIDPEAERAYVALSDGSLWCLSGAGEGEPIRPGMRTRVNPVAYLADALHLRTTDPLGLRARLSVVDPRVAADAVVDWAVRGAAPAAFAGAGFEDAVEELDDIGTLVGWDLQPDEASAVGEVLSVVWPDDDLDRKAGEVAGVVWTLVASALAGGDAVESRSVLLVERSRVLAAHPIELPIHELGGPYPYLTAGTPEDLGGHSDDVRRASLGLLAAAAAARSVDLAPDADDLLNEIRATGFELLESLLDQE